MAARVFISFAGKDRKTAETICSALEGRGFDCWISTRNIRPGENFQESIVQAIRSSNVMVFVFSANSNNSDEVKKEIALAGQQKLLVVPVRVENVEATAAFAYEFAIRQYIDFFDDWESGLDQLVSQLSAVDAKVAPGRRAEAATVKRRARRRKADIEAESPPVVAHPGPTLAEVASLFEHANSLAREGAYELAIEQYDKLIQLKPDYAEAFNNRGSALHALGKHEQALLDFDRAIDVKPSLASAYHNRGNAFQSHGDYDKAVRDYTIALQIKPDFVTALENRAKAYDRKGLFDYARKDRAAALALGAMGQGGAGSPSSDNGGRAIVIAAAVLTGVLLLSAIIGSILRSTAPAAPSSDAAAAASDAMAAASDATADAALSTAPPVDPAPNPTAAASTDAVVNRNSNVVFVNNTGRTMVRFFASHSKSQSWGDNRLQDNIQSGSQVILDVSDGPNTCLYDIQAVFDNQTVIKAMKVDLCNTAKYVFDESALTSDNTSAPASG